VSITYPGGFSVRDVTILDGYIDEPSCLGVPPYLSPHIRYMYGACRDAGATSIDYFTIDQIRAKLKDWAAEQQGRLVVIVCGTPVPGRYLGGRPISIAELTKLAGFLHDYGVLTYLSGPLAELGLSVPSIEHYTGEAAALDVYRVLQGPVLDEPFVASLARWAILGAEVVLKHPNFPKVVCELETFRGCLRNQGCTFCSERLKTVRYVRRVPDIIAEVKILYEYGIRHFRLGCQPDLLSFGRTGHKLGVKTITSLYEGIRHVAPDLKMLHMDNVNPTTVATHPECKDIIRTIVKHNTPQDVASFGLESADPAVLVANNIGTSPRLAQDAIRIINEIGGVREAGLCKLLPGINFLHGLQGETKATYEINLSYLQQIRDQGLLLRRINVRQVRPVGGYTPQKVDKFRFKQYKQTINEQINKPMLQQLYPIGTVLEDVIMEASEGPITFGRQLGSYPIRVGVPGNYPLGTPLTVKIIDHGFRSITGIRIPFAINQASLQELESIPGLGKKRARRIFLNLPIQGPAHLAEVLDPQAPLELLINLIDGY